MKNIVTAIVVCLAILCPPYVNATPGEIREGELLRDMPMQGILQPSTLLSTYFGKPLLINVWASWCGPCQDEIGSIQSLSRRYGGRQFNVIGISTDDYADNASRFVKHFAITFPNFLDDQVRLENMLGADHLPLTLLVSPTGKVLAKYYGARKWDSAESLALISKAFGVKL